MRGGRGRGMWPGFMGSYYGYHTGERSEGEALATQPVTTQPVAAQPTEQVGEQAVATVSPATNTSNDNTGAVLQGEREAPGASSAMVPSAKDNAEAELANNEQKGAAE